MELDKNYIILTQPTTGGQYQATLQKKTKVEDGTSFGEVFYSSKKYNTEDEAYQEVKDFLYDNFGDS